MDHVDKAKRSLIMAAVRPRGSGPEKIVRTIIRRLGYSYRQHAKSLPGCPDFVFPTQRKIVFVHGCFWHRHGNCRYSTTPKTQRKFWEAKFESNVARDRRNTRELRRMGWSVLTVWQCRLKKKERLMERLDEFLSN
ncbi:MAG: very short patch repair endonuclease [Candidatus Acidiferrales bacterium]